LSTVTLLWTPYPYQAGFTITDHTDGADFDSVKTMYGYLRQLGVLTTKTVWAFPPIEGCGLPQLDRSVLRGVTLQEPSYLQYCKDLNRCGYEICLHSASAGNSKREQTMRAFELVKSYFRMEGTFVPHLKNTENLYAEELIAPPGVRRALLKSSSHFTCCGELPGSEYFWGDLCLQHVRQMPLFRTRELNTLKVNPSMPSYDPQKPFVAGWFSTTRRSFVDCTTPTAMEALKRDNGLTVLHQYLHRWVDLQQQAPRAEFREAAERLVADTSVWVAVNAAIMSRLRAIQGIYMFYRRNQVWLCNVGPQPVKGLQLRFPIGADIAADHDSNLTQMGYLGLVRLIDPGKCVRVPFVKNINPVGSRVARLNASMRMLLPTTFGSVSVNLTNKRWESADGVVEPWTCLARFKPQIAAIKPLSQSRPSEISRLLSHEMGFLRHDRCGGKAAGHPSNSEPW
jgi:hypothetical protein